MLKRISELEELARELSGRVKAAAPEQYLQKPSEELDPIGRDWMDAVNCADETLLVLGDLRFSLRVKLEAQGVELAGPRSQAGQDGGAAESQACRPSPDADKLTP